MTKKYEYVEHSEPKSLLNFISRVIRFIWVRTPSNITDKKTFLPIGRYFYSRFTKFQSRDQSHSTWFLRNIPQTKTLVGLINNGSINNSTVKIASIGCSTGAELYSNLYFFKKMCLNYKFLSVGVDISDGVVEIAREGLYSLDIASSTGQGTYYEGEFELSHLRDEDVSELFDMEADGVRIKPWIRSDTSWVCMSAASTKLLKEVGQKDIVFAKNFLGPMESHLAEECLLNVLRLVKKGGYLVLDGVDLDVKCRVLSSVDVEPILNNYETIYKEDKTKEGWPWVRWSHEPIDTTRADWKIRYCSIFLVH